MAEPSFLQMLRNLFGDSPPAPAPAQPSPPPLRAPAPPPPPAPQLDLTRVPASARDRIGTIRTLIADLNDCAAARAGFDLTELTQIETVYLPRLLQSYADIPPQHRAEIFRDTGRSASFLLTERLDKIIDRLNEMSKDFARGHLDAFSDNMRFIDLRYGPGSSPFD